MRTTAKVLSATGAWLVAVAVLGGAVWWTVATGEDRIAVALPAGPVGFAADGPGGPGGGASGSIGAWAGAPLAAGRSQEWAGPTTAGRPPTATAGANGPAEPGVHGSVAATPPAGPGQAGRTGTVPVPAPRPTPTPGAGPEAGGGSRDVTGAPNASGDRMTPDLGAGTPPSGGVTAPDPGSAEPSGAVPIATRGGQLLVTCSAAGIGDLRAIIRTGWSGRWTVIGGEVTLWFTRDSDSRGADVQVVVVSCVSGVPEVRSGSDRTDPATWAAWVAALDPAAGRTDGGRSTGTNRRSGRGADRHGRP